MRPLLAAVTLALALPLTAVAQPPADPPVSPVVSEPGVPQERSAHVTPPPVERHERHEPSARHAMRLEVDKSERRLYVLVDGRRVESHPIAVGQKRWPTPNGHYTIRRVDWNPDWTPPSGSWARGKKRAAPGSKDNPMGRVRMPFHGAYALHGTRSLSSLGHPSSHGCVRVANAVVIDLAPRVMASGGAARSAEWIADALAHPGTTRTVTLPSPVPIDVHD
jgi:lipoprotein-anchoring transpeptidase ErfK/SrfK